jgi:hypothetical protein
VSEFDWAEDAWAALLALARTGEPFTADDLIARVGVPDEAHTPNSRPSRVGPIFARAARQGLIETDGTVRNSAQPHRRGGAQRVWRGTALAQRP